VLLNLLATPGLGSVIAGHRLAGAGQLLLAFGGFVLIMTWFFKIMYAYYQQINGGPIGFNPAPYGIAGALVFTGSWLWALFTSIQITRENRQPLPQAASL
jgi:hypothetical protein